MPLVLIDRTSARGGLAIERISTAHWRNLQTLIEWEKQNPKIWSQIKTFVYKRDLNKKPKRYPADLELQKKKRHPILG